MCHSYTFGQQRKRKLYSIRYKMVISCFANIPINSPCGIIQFDSRKATEMTSRASPAPSRLAENSEESLSCSLPGNLSKDIFRFLLREDGLLIRGAQGRGSCSSLRNPGSYSHPRVNPWDYMDGSKEPSFPKE